jgi:mono/diheme cytochrome c family protein
MIADAPDAITVTYSAPIDPDRSTLRLIGKDGHDVEGIEVSWEAPDTALLALPPHLPAGSWLVAWDVASGDASGSGSFGFTTGTDRDAAPLTIPDTGFGAAGGSAWLAALGGGALLLGACLLIAVAPLRLLLRPASPRLDTIAIAGAIAAAAGALAWIAALAWDAPHAGWVDRVVTALDGDTGRALLGAVALVSIHVIVLALGHQRVALATTLALPVPLALLSHAADEPAGRLPALTVAWVAIAALGVLAGGVIALVSTGSASLGRYPLAVAIALPALALAAAWLLWLFGGNLETVEATDWGRMATWGITVGALFAITLVAGLALVRRVGIQRALAVPALTGVALAMVAGSLMTIDTARTEAERAASQRTLPLTLGDDRAQLILAPGAAGVNHMRLEVDRASLPRGTGAELIVSLPGQPELGAQAVTLARVDGHAFEYHGTELAIADRWSLEVRLTKPAGEPVVATTSIDLADAAPRIDVPAVPWRFADFAGSAGVLLIVLGIAGIAVAVAAGKSPLRMESAGIGVGALLVAAILLGQGRLDPILARGGDGGGAIDPDDLTAITRGEEVYADSCLSCHGADLRGDGPAGGGLQPPPADFSAPHTSAHDDATLIYWVRHGKQGTAMPAFGGKLSDEEIADVLSYIARQQREMGAATPVP